MVGLLLARPGVGWNTDGCGDTKGCLRHPHDCTAKNCKYLVTWKNNGESIDFLLKGKSPGWLALGFSKDTHMGDDSITECLYISDTNTFLIQNSWNQKHKNRPLVNRTAGLIQAAGATRMGSSSALSRETRSSLVRKTCLVSVSTRNIIYSWRAVKFKMRSRISTDVDQSYPAKNCA